VFFLPVLFVGSAFSQTQDCKTRFSVVWKDPLNNVKQGLSPDDLKWFYGKMTRKYPDVCYDPGAAPVVFYVAAKGSTYHGIRVVSSTNSNPVNGTITDQNGNTSMVNGTVDTTTRSAVPYSVDYQDLILSVETTGTDGTWEVRHNFAHNTLGRAFYGVKVTNRHPDQELIEQAVKWIHDGGLNDPRQSVLAPQ